jgi:DNA mismatch endonuclease (patch repair protein)
MPPAVSLRCARTSKMTHRFSSDPFEVSKRMQLIRSKNTKPEIYLFSILTRAGLKFKRHSRVGDVTVDALVGKRVVVFVDSPFWHLRDRKELARMSHHWQQRLERNWARDRRQERRLRKKGYSVVRFWADRLEKVQILRRIEAARLRAKKRKLRSPPFKFLRHKTRSSRSQTRIVGLL